MCSTILKCSTKSPSRIRPMTDIPGMLANPSAGAIDLGGTVEQTPPPTTGMATCIEQCKFDHRTKRSG